MIKSLLRALEILDLMKKNDHGYTIAELSDRTELPPSTVHRILQTFCEMHYVTRNDESHTYELGPALISLGRAAIGNFDIQRAAVPVLRSLTQETREDSYLVVKNGNIGLVLLKQNGPNHLKVVEEFGYEMDLHCGAIRKVLLAYQPASYIRYYLDEIVSRPEAFPQISSRALEKELAEIRRDGYAISYGDYVHDSVGIGAPVFDAEGKISAALGIIAPISRVDDARKDRLSRAIQKAARDLSYSAGYAPA